LEVFVNKKLMLFLCALPLGVALYCTGPSVCDAQGNPQDVTTSASSSQENTHQFYLNRFVRGGTQELVTDLRLNVFPLLRSMGFNDHDIMAFEEAVQNNGGAVVRQGLSDDELQDQTVYAFISIIDGDDGKTIKCPVFASSWPMS
jgi:hypothetical protein